MARNFGNNKSNFLSTTTSIISATQPRPVSTSIWIYPKNHSTRQSLWANNNSNSPSLYWEINTDGAGNDVMRLYTNNAYNAGSSFALPINTWSQLGLTWNTDGQVHMFFNGLSVGDLTGVGVGAGDSTTGAILGGLNPGAGGVAGFLVDGYLAEFCVWNTILATSDMKNLAAGRLPSSVIQGYLLSYVPILGVVAPEPDASSSTGSGVTWAINGLLPSVNGPVPRPGPKRLVRC